MIQQVKFLNYSLSTNKIIVAKDKCLESMRHTLRSFENFIEKLEKGENKVLKEKNQLLGILSQADITPSLDEGMKSFVLNDTLQYKEIHKICKFIKKSFIPSLIDIIENYESSFSQSYERLSKYMANFNTSKENLEAKEEIHRELVSRIEDTYRSTRMKNYSEVLNHVVYEYRPFANKLVDSIEAYNDELCELYREFDNFSYKFEKLDKKRAIHYNYLLQDLETYINNVHKSAEDVISERFVTMNQIDARNDISISFTYDAIEDSTKIPEIMPEIDVDFAIRDYLESGKILITMQSQEYAITTVEIKHNGKVLASPYERITVFKYNKKVYLVHDTNDLLKIPLETSELIFKPEYVRYLAKVQGFENYDERQVIVVNSGDICECLDEFGNIKFIPAANLYRMQ